MRTFWVFASGVVLCLGAAIAAMAQGQGPQPPCDEQLNSTMFQSGELMKQLAVARAQLGAMTKERDALKAKAPTPEPEKK